MREEASVEALADFAAQGLGGIDIWVNNAGCSQSAKAPSHQTAVPVIRGSHACDIKPQNPEPLLRQHIS